MGRWNKPIRWLLEERESWESVECVTNTSQNGWMALFDITYIELWHSCDSWIVDARVLIHRSLLGTAQCCGCLRPLIWLSWRVHGYTSCPPFVMTGCVCSFGYISGLICGSIIMATVHNQSYICGDQNLSTVIFCLSMLQWTASCVLERNRGSLFIKV